MKLDRQRKEAWLFPFPNFPRKIPLCVDLEFIDPDNPNPISVDPDNFIFAMRCNLYNECVHKTWSERKHLGYCKIYTTSQSSVVMIHHHPYMILLQWIMIHTHFSYFETFFHQPMNYFFILR